MARRLLAPLGMAGSSLVWREEYDTRWAQGHDYDGTVLPYRKPKEAHAAHSLFTTPADYSLFVRAVLWPPEPNDTFLRQVTGREMLTPRISLRDVQLVWGLGWGLIVDDHESFWHWGQNEASLCFAAASPEKQCAIVVMTNGPRGGKVYQRIVEAVMGEPYPAFDWLNSDIRW